MTKVRIITDYREVPSGVPRQLVELGAEVEFQQLDIADFILSDRMAVERKTGQDLISSLVDDRLFEQAIRFKLAYPNGSVYLFERFADGIRNKSWQTRMHSIFGSMASLVRMGFTCVPTQGKAQTAIFLYRLAYQEQVSRNRSFTARSMPKRLKTLPEQRAFLLQGLYNCGDDKATILLAEYKTPLAILNAFDETKLLYTKTGNLKGFEGPLAVLKAKTGLKIGPKFVMNNKKIISELK